MLALQWRSGTRLLFRRRVDRIMLIDSSSGEIARVIAAVDIRVKVRM